MSPRQGSNTLPRSHAESPMRFGHSSLPRRDSGNGFGLGSTQPGTANSSASTTPTATPIVHRRSSFGSSVPPPQSQFSAPPVRPNVRRNSRTSPSPVRRRTLTPTSSSSARIAEIGSYNLALPRSLYGDDINGNNDMMTQSMDPSKLAGRLDNGRDLMTASLDPSILMANIDQDYRVSSENSLWCCRLVIMGYSYLGMCDKLHKASLSMLPKLLGHSRLLWKKS